MSVAAHPLQTRTKSTLTPGLSSIPATSCLNSSAFIVSDPPSYHFSSSRKSEARSEAERYAFGSEVREIVASDAAYADVSAIFVIWKVAARVYPSPTGEYRERQEADLLRMNEDIRRAADEHAAMLAPFVVVQWRMERTSTPNGQTPDYVACAKDAIKKIGQIDGINSVYLATDFPLQGYSHPHSDTMVTLMKADREIRQAAIAGMDAFLAGFSNTTLTRSPLRKRRSGLYLTSQHVQRPSVKFADTDKAVVLEAYDAGMTGVFDKLMAERAAYFYVGEPQRCARYSTFSKQIVLERVRRQQEGDVDIVTPVEYFGQPVGSPRHYPTTLDAPR